MVKAMGWLLLVLVVAVVALVSWPKGPERGGVSFGEGESVDGVDIDLGGASVTIAMDSPGDVVESYAAIGVVTVGAITIGVDPVGIERADTTDPADADLPHDRPVWHYSPPFLPARAPVHVPTPPIVVVPGRIR